MFDEPILQRSAGLAEVSLDNERLTRLHQSGSAKVLVPRNHRANPEIVFLNTSGGLTSCDRLDYRVDLERNLHATATTQTAERAYRADGAPATARINLKLGPGTSLDWLPQETILFDGASLRRETRVDLAADARFLGIETIILGRTAMGEVVTKLNFSDRRDIRRAGKRVIFDPFSLNESSLSRAKGHALLMGKPAMAVLILVEHNAADLLQPIRAQLDEPGVTGAASAREGVLVLRCVADDSWPLRRQMIRLIETLRPGALPRVWQN